MFFIVIFLRLIQSIKPEFQLADLQESVPAVETNGRKVFVPPDTDAKQVKVPFHFSHGSVLLSLIRFVEVGGGTFEVVVVPLPEYKIGTQSAISILVDNDLLNT